MKLSQERPRLRQLANGGGRPLSALVARAYRARLTRFRFLLSAQRDKVLLTLNHRNEIEPVSAIKFELSLLNQLERFE